MHGSMEALVDVDNSASQCIAEKVEFLHERVLLQHYRHKGRARVMVMYSNPTLSLPNDLIL